MSSSTVEKNENPRQLCPPWTDAELRALLPEPAPDANKYSRGVLTVVAGSDSYPGAACLASRAGQRMGAGYTEVVTSKSAMGVVLGAYPSLVVRDADCWQPGDMRNAGKGSRHAVCVGPGLVPGEARTARLVADVLKEAKCPVLVDGGGLADLGSKKALKALSKRREHGRVTVLTPHAGEAARLQRDLGVRADEPAQLAAVLSMATGAIVVVKGPDTFVSNGKKVYPVYEGTPALAKAGTGDVLAGAIAALLAQGVEPVGASVLGAAVHARAGSIAAQSWTTIGTTPEDVIEAIPAAIRSLAE